MNENWKHIFESGVCPEIDELKSYAQGNLFGERRFMIENHITGCEICSDLLEGFEALSKPESLEVVEKELKNRVHLLLDEKEKRKATAFAYRRWAVAASAVLIIGSGVVLYLIRKQVPVIPVLQQAERLEKVQPVQMPFSLDTVKILAEERENATKLKVKSTDESENRFSSRATITTDLVEEQEIELVSQEYRPASSYQSMENDESVSSLIIDSESEIKEVSPSINTPSERKKKTKINSYPKLIQGKLKADDGSPLPGVTIVIKGSSHGVITDIDGHYSITVPDSTTNLIYSYVGYLTEEIPVMDKENINVELKPDMLALEEVVVIGYGTQKKSEVTGAISVVNNNKKVDRKSQKVEQALQGKAAGLSVTREGENDIFDNSAMNQFKIDSLLAEQMKSPQDLNIHQALAEQYLEIGNKENALEQLQILSRDISMETTYEEFAEIIQLTKDEKYDKALRRLKKVELPK